MSDLPDSIATTAGRPRPPLPDDPTWGDLIGGDYLEFTRRDGRTYGWLLRGPAEPIDGGDDEIHDAIVPITIYRGGEAIERDVVEVERAAKAVRSALGSTVRLRPSPDRPSSHP